MAGTLLIRADATTEIGGGHFMRCMALAAGWQQVKGEVLYVGQCESDFLLRQLEDRGISHLRVNDSHPNERDLETVLTAAAECDWVVVDGYAFDRMYHREIRAAGHKLLLLDDYAHQTRYEADIILNQNIDAEQLHYYHNDDAKMLLGTSFALLRNEFLLEKDFVREVVIDANKVLVTLGASDPDNITNTVLHGLSEIHERELEIKVVLGPANKHLDSIGEMIQGLNHQVEIVLNVTHMAELMKWADIAVSAAGSTSWELCYLGLPSVLIAVAENQSGIASGLSQKGAAQMISLGDNFSDSVRQEVSSLLEDHVRRLSFSQMGRRVVDGQGVSRVISEMGS